MKYAFACLALVFALPAQATTYTFDLLFQSDNVFELQSGFDTCVINEACYPDDFRLPDGFFADLAPGERTTATVDLDAGTARIADWDVAGSLFPDAGSLAYFFSNAPIGSTVFTNDTVAVLSEGPVGYNAGGFCYSNTPAAGLPNGFCGFYGYEANFEVLGVTEVPLPAASLMLVSAIGILGAARRKRARKT
ncbi:MAG: VPLPA-CTERM sorting domain-containing protein [Paracoccaceae bacterium]